ncbi:Nonribosomal peptide synthetase 10 [Trichoderma ghanense]|uniref:Nonribosomal peptide synthetase 10 n=1 Tax=Trichoderma ghanense TaxID=65468 RepID=A0ABY2GZU0_9HYPO
MSSLPTDLCELFTQSVRQYPENLAIDHEDGALTYRELDDISSSLAHDLSSLGVGRGSPVLLVTAHGTFNVIAILAILKAGGCFVPIDRKSWSPQMIDYVCETVESQVVINTTPELFRAANGSHHVLHITTLPPPSGSHTPSYSPQPNDDACIIFTSGSTGRPKGVILSHKAFCLYSQTSPMNLDIVPGDRLLHILSVAFDALGNGGTVVPAQAEDIYAKASSCTVLAATPSILSTLMDSTPESDFLGNMHTVILGGETATSDLLASLVDAGIRVLIGYGATETTSMGSIHVVSRDPVTNAINPQIIGGSIVESPIWLVGDDMEAIEDEFTEGEIYIAGDGVSRGYYNDKLRTNDSFIYWNSRRVYKTGDYGLWVPCPEGGRLIEFCGRKDRTVKNGGFLVNLDRDVENALSRAGMLLGVASVCAAVTEDGIIAVVTPETVDTLELLAIARQTMCSYCIPYRIEAVQSFPVSPNGKIQHKKVLEIISTMDGGRAKQQSIVTTSVLVSQVPDTETLEEQGRLAKILNAASNLFGRLGNDGGQIQPSDSFLRLGGSSLLAFKLVSALRQLNLDVSLRDLFSCRTFEDIAKSSATTVGVQMEASKLSADESFAVTQKLAVLRSQARSVLALKDETFDVGPLTSLQLTFAFPTLACSSKNVNQVKLAYAGRYATMMERAWRVVWQAEPVFRTEICLAVGCGAQIVHKKPFRKHKLHLYSNLADYENTVDNVDMGVGLGCSLEFIAYCPNAASVVTPTLNMPRGVEELTVILTAHHSLMDGISLQILLETVESVARGRQLPSSPSSIEANLELISLQQKNDTEAKKFFAEYLKGVCLTNGLPKEPTTSNGELRDSARQHNTLLFGSSVASHEVAEFASKNCLSAACVYYTTWAMAMGTFERKSTVAIGSVFSNRASQPEHQNTIGLYMSTLPLVVHLDAEEQVSNLLHKVMDDILTLGEYAWARSDQVGTGSSMSSLVALQPALPDEHSNPPAVRAESIENSAFPLSLLIESNGEFRILYNDDIFDEYTIRRLGGHFKQALRGVLQHARVGDCMRLNELQETAYQQAEAVKIHQSGRTVRQMLEDSIDQFPENVAIEDHRGVTLSYGELEKQTNIIANHVDRHLADTKATAVAVYGDGSVGWLLGLVGILKTNRAFVPLDPKWPMERKAMVLEASGAAAVLVPNSTQRDDVPTMAGKEALAIEDLLSHATDADVARLPDVGSLDSVLVYIFTSGTTGAPKGIPTTNQSFLAFQSNPEATMFAAPGRRIAQFMSPAFDACNEEIFSALLHGATLVLREPADPYAHLQRVNTVTMTPAVLSVLEPDDYPDLEIIYATGEAITAPIIQKFAGKKLLYNAYGPAECSISTSFERMIQGDTITIGTPSATARMYLLDEQQCLVPKGVQGEIYLAGVQVLQGYINAPEQTALRVLPDPWHPNERMYRTGDYGIREKDDRVVYIGRMDRQVKVRGFRIELDGVEHAILSEPTVDGVSQCAVLAVDGALVAYVAFAHSAVETSIEARIGHLRGRLERTLLPSWVPQQIISIDDFPRSMNGKVDNKALEEMYRSKSFFRHGADHGPSESVASKLAEAWREILQLGPQVNLGPAENFFALGGHSVLVLLLATKLTAIFGVEITARELLPAPSFQAQVDTVEGMLGAKGPSASGRTDSKRNQSLPTEELTELERQVWFQYQVGTTTTAFNIANVLTVHGRLDYARLVDSFNTALASDPVLRSNFVEGPDGVRRVIRVSSPRVYEVEELDVAAEVNHAFDLARDAMIRVHFMRPPGDGKDRQRDTTLEIVIVTSHSIADLGTLQNLLRLVSDAYDEKSVKIHDKPQHLGSSQWHYTPSLSEQGFWRNYLAGHDTRSSESSRFSIPLLPSATAAFHGTSRTLEFNGDVIMRLNSLIKRLGITHHHMALTIAALLSRWILGEDDVILGTPNANRPSWYERESLGQFLDRLPVRVKLDNQRGGNINRALTNVRDSAVQALANAIPFSRILEALDISGGHLQHPVFDCMVTFHPLQTSLATWLKLPDCEVTVSPRFAEGSKFPLMLEWFELDSDRWSLHIEHDTNRLPSALMVTVEDALQVILEAIVDECSLVELDSRLAAVTEADPTNGYLATRNDNQHGLQTVSGVIGIIQREMVSCLNRAKVQILPDTCFFSAGADSNAAVKLRHRLRALGLEVPLRAIFTARSPAELVKYITHSTVSIVTCALSSFAQGWHDLRQSQNDLEADMATETKLPIWKIAAQQDEFVWYLGYGSNMKASAMKDRKITPLATKIVNVPTHYVTFDVFGIPYSEPCYASIEELPNGGTGKLQLVHGDQQMPVPSLCGLAHLLTTIEFHQLLVTEGSGVVYDIVKLQAYEIDESHKISSEPFDVYTLKAKWPLRPNGTPSARYVNLFLHGAIENNLPSEYIQYLESFPRYLKLEGRDRTYGQLVFDAGWRPFLKRLVRLTTWRVDGDGNCPAFIALIIVWAYRVMWLYHDYVHQYMLGAGDGGKIYWKKLAS